MKAAKKERRLFERRYVAYDAQLSIPNARRIYPCRIRDVTDAGLGLRLDNSPLLPLDFHLSFDGFLTTLECQLVWRHGAFMGVALKATFRG